MMLIELKNAILEIEANLKHSGFTQDELNTKTVQFDLEKDDTMCLFGIKRTSNDIFFVLPVGTEDIYVSGKAK